MFLFGAMLVEWPRAWRSPGSGVGTLAGLLALGVMLVPAPGSAAQAWRILALGLGFALLCQACFAGRAAWLAQALSWLPLRWLGNMSYSYYLLHGLALHVFFAALPRLVPPGDGGAAALLIPAFVWTLLPCAVLFLAVERPWSLAPVPRTGGRSAKGAA
jgi:peptidoglycan/LPS O-acetylase OafA/YrhL